MIAHCASEGFLAAGGGAVRYLKSLSLAQTPGVSPDILRSLKGLDQSRFTLLHVHDATMLSQLSGGCSAVYSAHAHELYCPSGTKHLRWRQAPCHRAMSLSGCLFGHLVERCGSVQPRNLWRAFQRPSELGAPLRKLGIPVLAMSRFVRSQLVGHGFPSDRVFHLPYGSLAPQGPLEALPERTHKGFKVLFVGRIVPEKGLDWLLKALARVDPRITLTVAGDGYARPGMEKMAQELGVDARVQWRGWCSRGELERLYCDCAMVAFPSVWHEPAGIVSLEAAAHCRAVVASSVGGIPEYLRDGETGILVPPYDVPRLAAALTELSMDYQKSRRLGERGRDLFLAEFTLERHIQGLLKIYERCVAEFASRGKPAG